MNITFLGAHNCESRDTRLVTLLIDDFMVIDAGAITSSLTWSAQLKLKAILLTHRHYDHIRDMPTVAMNLFLNEAAIKVYSIPSVYDAIKTHLLNGELYPNFLEHPPGNPALSFSIIEPGREIQIEGYSVLALPVSHSVPAVGYQITSPDGKAMFYTSDTGPGLAGCWKEISPRLLVIEVTASNRYEDFARESGHFTPSLLKQELAEFRKLKGYLPEVITVHMNPGLEGEIEAEIALLAESLKASIKLAYEGMKIQL